MPVPPSVLEALLSGAPSVVLGALLALWILGVIEVRTKPMIARADAAEAAARLAEAKAKEELIAEVRRDRDEWRDEAKTSLKAQSDLADALTVRNRIDQGIARAGAGA